MSMKRGEGRTRMYVIWQGMKARCKNPNHASYKYYGGKGVTVCEEWEKFLPFKEWALKNGYTDELTIDRIDNSKGYSPDNCRWIARSEQTKNQTSNVKLIYRGELHTPNEVSHLSGVSVNTIYFMHREHGITDFTDYKPRHADNKYIVYHQKKYQVAVRGKYIGKYVDLETAIKARDKELERLGEVI